MSEPNAQAQAQQAVKDLYNASTALSSGFSLLSEAMGFGPLTPDEPVPIPPDPPPSGDSPFRFEVEAKQLNPRIVQCSTRGELDAALAQLRANDRIVLTKDGNYGGAPIIIQSPGTKEQPVIICCQGDAKRLKPSLTFKVTIKGQHCRLWGIKLNPDNEKSQTGRLVIDGATAPLVERCEITGWLPDGLGSASGGAGYAVRLINGGSGFTLRKCFVHDPGPWTAAEKADKSGQSLRIFLRNEGKSFEQLHKNGLVEDCMFASTVQRPVPDAYDAGQADLGENGSQGPSYAAGCNVGWIYRGNIFDGTGQGGAPKGFTLTMNGDVDPNPSGVVDTKIGGVTYEDNTFRNFRPRAGGTVGRVEARFGESDVWRRNWCDRASISVQGGHHDIISNVVRNGGVISVLAGDIKWNAYQDGHQAAYQVLCQDNEGELQVGRVFGSSDQFPADETKLRGSHKGKIITKNSYQKGDFQLDGELSTAGGYAETETTFSGTREVDRLDRPTGPRSNEAVGPFS